MRVLPLLMVLPVLAMFEGGAEWFAQYGVWGLALLAFIQASVFPIPPEVLLIPLCLQEPDKAYWYAGICTVASVSGSLLGYAIGRTAGNGFFVWMIRKGLVRAGDFERAKEWLVKYDMLAIFSAAFTPLPYKVFTIAAGIVRMNIPRMVIAGLIGRAGAYFSVALICAWLGPQAEELLSSKVYSIATLVLAALLVGGAVLMYRRQRPPAVAVGEEQIDLTVPGASES